jgi:DNA (cytosine-5)-methyltransferase 1
LAEMGFDARWGVLGAAHAGAPHLRERIWILADADGSYSDGWRGALQMGRHRSAGKAAQDGDAERTEWATEPGVGILAYGVAQRVEQLTALGNGQVPAVVRKAWRILTANAICTSGEHHA